MSLPPTRGLLLVISSPSGAGKTTLSRRLAAQHDLRFSVSYTTRRPRAGEVDGHDYHFVTGERFDEMAAAGQFAEWAVVHGNKYATSIATVNAALADGVDCLFDIDHQGGAQLRRLWPAESVLCFVLPPSLQELARRLRARGTDAPDVIERRLATACEELRRYGEYDYLVVNDNLEKAYDELRSIYVAARCIRFRKEATAQALLRETGVCVSGRPP